METETRFVYPDVGRIPDPKKGKDNSRRRLADLRRADGGRLGREFNASPSLVDRPNRKFPKRGRSEGQKLKPPSSPFPPFEEQMLRLIPLKMRCGRK